MVHSYCAKCKLLAMVAVTVPTCDNFDRTIVNHAYYHGLLPREDVPYLLQLHGDFLVRIAQAANDESKMEMVLSVMHDPTGRSSYVKNASNRANSIVHLVIQSKIKGKFSICNEVSFNSVNELVKFFSKNIVVVRKMSIKLGRPITFAPWEIEAKHVTVGVDILGGPGLIEVHKGSINVNGVKKDAAVKIIYGKTDLAKEAMKEMIRQCRLLRELHHPCLLQHYGVCFLRQPCYFFEEFVSEGKLNLYLIRNRGNLKRDELLQMMMTAGWGIDHLHSKGILHRDLSARNCLYNKHLVKISGFAFARKALVYSMKSRQRMPIRWMAPESVEMFHFSQKSDVYSYGVLIYEIFSQCEPYEGLTAQEVKVLIKNGQVNLFPAKTPKGLADYVKQKMWDINLSTRPNMIDVMKHLTKYTGFRLVLTALGEFSVKRNIAAPVMTDVDFEIQLDEGTIRTNVIEAVKVGGRGEQKMRAEKDETRKRSSAKATSDTAESVKELGKTLPPKNKEQTQDVNATKKTEAKPAEEGSSALGFAATAGNLLFAFGSALLSAFQGGAETGAKKSKSDESKRKVTTETKSKMLGPEAPKEGNAIVKTKVVEPEEPKAGPEIGVKIKTVELEESRKGIASGVRTNLIKPKRSKRAIAGATSKGNLAKELKDATRTDGKTMTVESDREAAIGPKRKAGQTKELKAATGNIGKTKSSESDRKSVV